MAESLFDKIQSAARRKNIEGRSRSARVWFQNQAKKLGATNREKLLNDPGVERVSKVGPGNMFMFFYDPKTKEQLPYYDKFPLILMVEPAPGGFYGINLHYLPPGIRAQFLDQLQGTLTDKRYDENTRFRLSYNMLKAASRFKEFKPCYKRYLTTHIKSRISKVHAKDWEIAIFLPTEDFSKKGKRAVWADSRGKY